MQRQQIMLVARDQFRIAVAAGDLIVVHRSSIAGGGKLVQLVKALLVMRVRRRGHDRRCSAFENFPVSSPGNLGRKTLDWLAFISTRVGIGAEFPVFFPVTREIGISETSSLVTASSSGESGANLTSSITLVPMHSLGRSRYVGCCARRPRACCLEAHLRAEPLVRIRVPPAESHAKPNHSPERG